MVGLNELGNSSYFSLSNTLSTIKSCPLVEHEMSENRFKILMRSFGCTNQDLNWELLQWVDAQ